MKKKIIIVSDIVGTEGPSSAWIHKYYDFLIPQYEVSILSALVLAGITSAMKSREEIHSEFLNGGIDAAVDKLLNDSGPVYCGIGFSIGGTILWKAALKGLDLSALICFSSTRLRFEISKPSIRLQLYYGEDDVNRPGEKWFLQMLCDTSILPHKGHEFYKEDKDIEVLSTDISNFLDQ